MDHTSDHARRWPAPSLPALLLLLAAVLAFRLLSLALGGLDLFYDEAQYWYWAQTPDVGYFSKPGMIAWIIAATTALFGDSPAAVRLASPLLHTLTALAICGLGTTLYDRRIGWWSALGYALMPAVAVSSLIISTDVPLLLFWTLGLIAAHRLSTEPGPRPALLMGLAIALGINAKYAMVYLPVMTVLHLALERDRRAVLRTPWPWIAIAVGALGFLPNLLWNVTHDFVTFSHTGDNTGLGQAGLHPGKALEFVASQFAIAGPILLGAALLRLTGRLGSARPAADRFLLAHSIPVLAVVAINAIFGKMNANWAATAFPAIVVLGTALLVGGHWRRLLIASMAIGATATLAIGLGAPTFRFVEPPRALAQVRKMVHWRDYGVDLAKAAHAAGVPTIVMVGRELSAQGTYILDGSGLDVRAYKADGAAPADHFQMVIPWSPANGGPVLLVTEEDPADLGLDGLTVTKLADVPAAIHGARNGTLPLYRVDGPAHL